jgi:hypothetical protein
MLNAVVEHPWDQMETEIRGSLKLWCRSFPNAIAACIKWRKNISASDLMYLEGVQKVNITAWGNESPITDATFVHFRGCTPSRCADAISSP